MTKLAGIISIEALIAMFIFSFGSLTLLGMQASLYARNQDARFRMQASAFVNELLSMAIADPANAACYTVPVNAQQNCAKPEAKTFTASWVSEVTDLFPAAAANPPKATSNANGSFTISLFWQRPQDSQLHSYVLTTQLGT